MAEGYTVYRKLLQCLVAMAGIVAAVGCVSGPSNPGGALPTRQEERITDQAIRADHDAIGSLQQRLSQLNNGGRRINDYHFAKAQCWLDFAFHEYHQNDRTGVIEAAMRESGGLIAEMEKGNKNIYLDTPIVSTSERLRPDLWARLDGLKKHRDLTCGAASVACAEVRLVWAGHENRQTGWRHASPWIGIAEDLIDNAERDIKACPQPAPKPVAKVSPPPAPVPKPAAVQKVLVAGAVHFALDKAAISAATAGMLDRVAAVLRQHPQASVTLKGHTDNRASEKYNVRLSEQRAQAVRGYLIAAGVDQRRVTVEAHGARQLQRTGNAALDHAHNRRVELAYGGVADLEIASTDADLQPE